MSSVLSWKIGIFGTGPQCLFPDHMAEYDPIELIVNTVQELSLAEDLATITYIVKKAARRATKADGVSFVMIDDDHCHYVDEDAIAPLWKGKRFPIQSCISGWVMVNKLPAVIRNIYDDSRIPHDIYHSTFVKSLVMVPIRKSNPMGALGAYWAVEKLPTEQEIHLLSAIADVTAVALRNLELQTKMKG